MTKGFYFDQNSCIGCRTCEVACIESHAVPRGAEYRRVHTYTNGAYPNAFMYHMSIACNHCENPICVSVCPTLAMHRDPEDGTVQHDDEKCIGCRSCAMACPYGAPHFVADQGIVKKCDACIDFRAQGEEPACVAACPMRALAFGEVEDLTARFGADAVSETPDLPPASYTTPSLLVKRKRPDVAEPGETLRV